jgi:hypothetical protein
MPRTREGRLVSPPRPSARLMSPTRSVRMKYTVAQPSPSSPSSSPATTGTRRGLGSPSRAVRTLGSPSRAARTLGSPARSTRGRGGAASSLAPAPLRRTLGKLQRCRAINDLHEDVQSRRLCGLWIGAIEAEARAEAARLRSSAAGCCSSWRWVASTVLSTSARSHPTRCSGCRLASPCRWRTGGSSSSRAVRVPLYPSPPRPRRRGVWAAPREEAPGRGQRLGG